MMSRPRSKIQKDFNKINSAFEELNEQLVKRIKLFGTGKDDIVKAFELVDYEERFLGISLEAMLSGASAGYGTGYGDINRARNFFTKHKWADGKNLSMRITKGTKENIKIVQSVVSESIDNANAWTKVARNIDQTKLVKADVAKHMWNVIRYGRRNLNDDPATARAYERAVRESQRQIERLAANGAPTQRLKKAYQNVIKATELGKKQSINNAIERAVKAKSNYNAQRIARTEAARAYGQGFFASCKEDGVHAYRSVLSSRHKIVDVCDMHAEADFYGLGQGVYPASKGPAYPYHPHCLCVMEKIYSAEPTRTKYNKTAGAEYLKNHPRKSRQILGKGRFEKFGKKPEKWESLTPNYNGHEFHKVEIPVDLFDKE